VNPIQSEPVVTFVGGGIGIVNGAMLLYGSFWHPLTPEQVVAVNSFSTAVLVFLARGRVTPVK